MGTRQDKDQEKSPGKNAEPEAGKAIASDPAAPPSDPPSSPVSEDATPASAEKSVAAMNDLPMVEAPKLGSGEPIAEPAVEAVGDSPKADTVAALPTAISEPVDEAPSESASAAPAPQQRSFRFALLAATIAFAAGIGSFIGALTASGIGGHPAPLAAIPRTADARDIIQALRTQLAELSALKTSLDGANRSTGAQFAKIADRLNSLEHAQAEPAAKLAHIADALDRLDMHGGAAADITGSIATSPPAASAPAVNVTAPIVRDWVVQDVRNGRAMVESSRGGLFLVGAGSLVPGLGRVQEVKRQNGQWVVVTDKGMITSVP